MKPQHFVIFYLMEVSVMVEIIQKERDVWVGCDTQMVCLHPRPLHQAT